MVESLGQIYSACSYISNIQSSQFYSDRRDADNVGIVGRWVYDASWPLWFSVMNSEKFLSFLESRVRESRLWMVTHLRDFFFLVFPIIKYFTTGSEPIASILNLAAQMGFRLERKSKKS